MNNNNQICLIFIWYVIVVCPPHQNVFGCGQCIEGFFGDPSGHKGYVTSCKDCNCNNAGVQKNLCNDTGYCK